MKSKVVLFGLGSGLLLALGACNSSNNTEASSDSTAGKMSSSDTVKASAPVADQDFVNYAVPGNTKEIIWLKAGIAQSSNHELKSHAHSMLKDHEKLDSTVKGYLSMHSDLIVPSVDTSNVVNIQGKKGKEWDKAWVDQMVQDHSDLLDKLKKSQGDIKDTALLSIVNNTIPVVQSHLDMVKNIQKKMK
jgi:putative membrane protein